MSELWAAPESSAPQPTRGADIVLGSAAEVAALDGERAAPQVPLELEPHSILEIIDGSFTIMRSQPGKVLALICLAVLPVNLFVAYLQRDIFADGGPWAAFERGLNSSGDFGALGGSSPSVTAAAMVLPGMSLVLVSAALSTLVAAWHSGRDYSVREVLGILAKRWWQWPLAWLLVHVLELIGFIMAILPGIFAVFALVFTIPVMAIEGEKPWGAMRRSKTLVSGALGRVATMVFSTIVIVNVINTSLGVVPTLLSSLFGSYGWIVVGVGSMLAAVLSTGATAGTTLLLYFDLRIRREGLDLEMEALEHVSGAKLR